MRDALIYEAWEPYAEVLAVFITIKLNSTMDVMCMIKINFQIFSLLCSISSYI